MSFIQSIKTEIRNMKALERACPFVDAKFHGLGEYYAGGSKNTKGYGVTMPGFHHTMVVNPETGDLHYDTDNAGNLAPINRLKQRYGIEAAKMAAEDLRYTYREQSHENGNISLEIDLPEKTEELVAASL